ncbi:MAG: competence/damage-inducible protein A [Anaerolineae bacterium]|jgi:nicotinamide-nucleotide amidase|nr:competence/damage-inducible protein A [Anaerolineae bacterium]MBT7075073.1 competence/damage-inducible protein A [Anaerolineae bacterium]MBT7781971.1 competence/damage-inducible protein A [Anaerolineae bacterium]
MSSAEIITIGTEILLGEIVDTNTRYLARNLRDLGVDLYRTITIGDNAERIAETIRESMKRTEIIITTGGLGPTIDDPTREAISLATGMKTEFRPDLWEEVKKHVSLYGRKPTENQKRQAYVPEGAIALENPVGTAPCFIVETERNAIISLPGVPREMETVLHESVIPYLQERYSLDEIIKVRVLSTAGIGEGRLDEKIADLEKLGNPTVGLSAHTGVVDIRLAAKAKTEDEANAMLLEVETELRQRLGKFIFGTNQAQLADVALAAVESQGWKLVTLESGLEKGLANHLEKTANPALIYSENRELNPKDLEPALRQLKKEKGADAALGIALFAGEDALTAELVLLTPKGNKIRTLRYGGHPKNALRWAPNIAINILRRSAE